MKRAKGMEDSFNMDLALMYAQNKARLLAIAYVKDIPQGFEAYIVDDNHIRTWLAAFAFREETNDAQVLSRAHQQLVYEVMKYCVENEINHYDFGGIDSIENPNGIDNFKIAFAKDGKFVSYTNCFVGKSMLGKPIITMLNILKKPLD